MNTIPFTYLIGWSHINKWYYGVRYAKGCQPSDLWTIYKTSSKKVKKYVDEYGNPDVITVRKIFNNTNAAQQWEHKVLRRLQVVESNNWINCTDNKAISYEDTLVGSTLGANKTRGMKQSQPHIDKKTTSLIATHNKNLEKYGEKRPNFSNIASNANKKRLENKNHHFLNTENQRKWAEDKVRRGVQGPYKKESIQKLKDWAQLALAAGDHPTQIQWACPHCGTSGKSAVNRDRWHFNNCRNKK